ncbi:hypothetical protein FRC04_011508 [Tulasnella sp. 424]|nr:hypothetical protein FRC04_011508 [Tulasnella sp. 424]KAG8971670.1 hypothetical protein FRC05_010926 [Tulasnella sp. 425]
MIFHGLSGILDAKDDLFALSHARGRYKAGFVQNSQTGAYVHLQRPSKIPLESRGDSPKNIRIVTSRGDFCQVQHEIVDIQIRSDIIVAARNTHLDLYLTTQVASVLQQPLTRSDIPAVLPFQSLAYPALTDSVYRGNLLRQPNPTLGIDPGDIALLSAENAGCYGILAKPKGQAGTVSEAHGFEIQPLKDIASPNGAVFQAVIGQSGRRMAVLTDVAVSVYFTSAPTVHHGEPNCPSELAVWKIPGASGDVPCGLDFDENSGICMVAMASGRIWVVDVAHMSVQHQDTTELHPLPLREKYNGELPTPYPSQWHIKIPFVNPFEVGVPSVAPPEVAPGWSDAVDEYFPYKNRPNFYGGTVWLLHEAFHLPVVQPGHGTSSDEEYGARTVLFKTTELSPSGYRDECLEVIEVRPLPGFERFKGLCLLAVDYGEWYFNKLDPTYDLPGIVKYLQDGGNIDDLRQDPPGRSHLPPDDVKLGQYRLCRELYTKNFGPAGGTVLPW